MVRIAREVIAFPFYLLAFVFHLLCAFFTWAGDTLAGHNQGPANRNETISVIAICAACLTFALTALAKPEIEDQSAALAIRAPIEAWRNVPLPFTADQPWAKSLIELNACVFAQRVVRNELNGATVQFEPCGTPANRVWLDAHYFEATLSGVARVNAKETPFKVFMNHFPPSTGLWGFVATGLEIEPPTQSGQCVASATP